MKKTNSFNVFKAIQLMMAFSLISCSVLAEMSPVRVNFLYVASGVTTVNPDTVPGWNTVSFHQAWHSRSGLTSLKDINGAVTALGVKVTSDFFGYNSSGASSTTLGMVDLVSKTNYYGNSTSKGGITLSGLNPGVTYKITVFGSRNGTTSNADVVYTLNDAAQSTLTLSCANNVSGLAIFNNIIPNTDGTLVMNLDKAATNTIGYTYLAAVQIEEAGTTETGFLPILVNFGPAAVTGWNTLTTYSTAGAALSNMADTGGNATNIALKVTTGFFGIIGTTGMGSTTTPLNMPDDVSKSNMFKNGNGGALTLTGLEASRNYKFTIFGSRGGLTEARDVVYVLNDENGSNVTLNVANNATNVAVLDNIAPNADGSLILTLNFGTNNTTYTYINALKIDTATTTTGIFSPDVLRNDIYTYKTGMLERVVWNDKSGNKAIVQVFTINGKQLQQISVSGSNSVDIDLDAPGMYIVKVKSGDNSYVTKFVR
jgi:hypothetical protein